MFSDLYYKDKGSAIFVAIHTQVRCEAICIVPTGPGLKCVCFSREFPTEYHCDNRYNFSDDELAYLHVLINKVIDLYEAIRDKTSCSPDSTYSSINDKYELSWRE